MKKKDTDEILRLARERFDEAVSAEDSNRALSIYDELMENGDSTNGDQWTEEEKQQRAGRPCLTINRLAGTTKSIIGDARQNRPRIKVRPEDSVADPIVAQIMTGLIRNIENMSDAESSYDTGIEQSVRGGWGYWRVLTKYADDDSFDQDIVIERIVNKYSVYYDQEAIKQDFTDAEYCFVTATLSKKKFEVEYPDASSSEWEQGQGESSSGWFASDTVRVAEYFYKERYKKHLFMVPGKGVIEIQNPTIIQKPEQGQPGLVQDGDGEAIPFTRQRDADSKKVLWCKLTGNEIIDGPTEWPGKYIPIIPCLGEEVWLEGERVLRSAIRFATEPQKLYNWAASNGMETLALAPKQPWVISDEQLGKYKPVWDKAYSTPMPYLPYHHVDGQPAPQRLSGSSPDSGAIQFGAQAVDDIKVTTGIYDAGLGARSNETSGKAINARKQQGATATFVFTDNQVRAIKHTGRILIDLIPKVYDSERIVRIMGDDLNKSLAALQQSMPQGDDGLKVSEDGTSAWVTINFEVVNPVTGEKKIYNDLSAGKYDMVVDAGPGYVTKRLESADGMIALGQASPNIVPILAPRIAKAQDWPDAQEIGDEIKAMMQPQPPQPPPPPQPSPKDMLDVEKGKLDLQMKGMDLEGKKMDLDGKAMQQQQSMIGNQQHIQLMYQIAQKAVIDTLQQLQGGGMR